MKLIIFLAILAAVGGIGFWYVTNNPEAVDDFLENFASDPTSVSTDSGSDQAGSSGSNARSVATPTASAPSSSRDVSFVFDSGYSAGVDSDAVALMRDDMLDLINAQRGRSGAGSVRLGSNRSPQSHAEYMRDNCTVGHRGSGGSDKRDRWLRAGGNASVTLGETVNGYRDCSFNVPRSRNLYYYVDKLMDTLMNSSAHREIILDPKYDEVHLGLAISPNGMWVTQLFVDRR